MKQKSEIGNLTTQIPTKIKSQELIDDKRQQIIKRAIIVFRQKGYHKTTVRDIAKAAQISMGSLYDYINCKEDILYLFYKHFIFTYYQEMVSRTKDISNPKKRLMVAFKTLLDVGFSLEDEILFGWTESKNMKEEHLKEILRLELDVINFFKDILDEIAATSAIKMGDTYFTANFLVYCSTFGILRNWALKPHYTKEQITNFIMNSQIMPLVSDLND
ncbi:MAG TPA: TetR/AcrR family transcriptional regulator [Thermodesulfobacteriota bacterium]|nr:TetR/AcrR family transcriptional regulator [Deltaproteobacteria bacterium]HNR11697.1 TetR/AcrR family transcriptional regulator [Thermodesulfobacteriota bacterium]HNU71033.1 TetR/AcrR family transcriptional regulator [Thermodesulfobacteriota bacterium]HOC37708.1 TetR/AcrR family transcriptional regulator [Thermodesulfobacteriota bacterium]HQO76949.1 TetR/AcrR family transcriptional regulator [Thermodesulfobacteriota bacterium]